MRIAIIAPEFPPDIGGMERYSWEIAHGLARQGCTVTVFTIKRSLVKLISSSVEILPCLMGHRWFDKKIIAARARDFDIWHVTNAAWAWVAQEVTPVFVSIHGNDFLYPNVTVRLGLRERFHLPWSSQLDFFLGKRLTALTMRKSLSRVRHVFANSGSTEALFLARFPFCKCKTTVGYVGVSNFFLHSPPRAPRKPPPHNLITICRLSERRKNVDVVLHSLAILKNDFKFLYFIIGDGYLRPGLERLAQHLGLSDRVVFVGECSDDALRERLLDSDLFILTSSASPKTVEGFGIVYLEANACGVPVLAAKIGGAVEAVTDGSSGMLVDAVTPNTLAAALAKILSGNSHFDRESCKAFAREFSWDKVVNRIMARYAETEGKS